MYYNTIISNLNTPKQVTSKDFATKEGWTSYTSVTASMLKSLAEWRKTANDEHVNAFFKALKEFYSLISTEDGIERQGQYVPQDAKIELARYAPLSAVTKTRYFHNDASMEYEDTVVIPLNAKKRMYASRLALNPAGVEKIGVMKDDGSIEYTEHRLVDLVGFYETQVDEAEKKCKELMDVRKRTEPVSDVTFRKGFETALAEAIVGKEIMTVAERNIMTKAQRDATRAKNKAIENMVEKATNKQVEKAE